MGHADRVGRERSFAQRANVTNATGGHPGWPLGSRPTPPDKGDLSPAVAEGGAATHFLSVPAFYLREIIEQGIEDLGDYYPTADIPERVRKGREHTHAAADVRRALGLDSLSAKAHRLNLNEYRIVSISCSTSKKPSYGPKAKSRYQLWPFLMTRSRS